MPGLHNMMHSADGSLVFPVQPSSAALKREAPAAGEPRLTGTGAGELELNAVKQNK